jgi:hypothetical protein
MLRDDLAQPSAATYQEEKMIADGHAKVIRFIETYFPSL